MRTPRRTGTVLAASAVLVVLTAGVSAAAWEKAGTGVGGSRATSLLAPASASAAPTAGSPSSSITVTWTPPSSGPTPTGYVVTRVSTGTDVCTTGAAARSCTDAGLIPSTTYDYRVVAVLQRWNGTSVTRSAQTQAAASTGPALAVVDAVGSSGGSGGTSTSVTPTCSAVAPARTCTAPSGSSGNTRRFTFKVGLLTASGSPYVNTTGSPIPVALSQTGQPAGSVPATTAVASGASVTPGVIYALENGSSGGTLTVSATVQGAPVTLSLTIT